MYLSEYEYQALMLSLKVAGFAILWLIPIGGSRCFSSIRMLRSSELRRSRKPTVRSEWSKAAERSASLWPKSSWSASPEMDVKQSHHITKAWLEKKVFLASGADFGSDKPGWFRIVFAHEDHYLQEGLTRITAALEAAWVLQSILSNAVVACFSSQ